MFKSTHKMFSLMFTAILLVSLFVMPFTANACEEEPQTLLSLYLRSKLIVIADIENSKSSERLNEDEYGYGVNVVKTLKIVKTFRGSPDLKTVSFTNYEYHQKITMDNPDEENYLDHYSESENFVDVTKIKVGERYMFFLSKYEGNEEFSLSDYSSSIKKVDGTNVFEKSITELNEIAKMKKGQKQRLLEWMVKSIEEPETREDAIRDISEGLYSYIEDTENADVKKVKPFVFDENFDLYSSNISKSLSDSQKSRISAVLYPLLQESWFAEKPKYVHYGISGILTHIDKPRLAIYTYNMLKSVGKDDVERRNVIMQFLIGVADDEDLSKIYYSFNDLNYELKSNKEITAEELKTKNELKKTMLKNFDKQFELILSKNFKTVK